MSRPCPATFSPPGRLPARQLKNPAKLDRYTVKSCPRYEYLPETSELVSGSVLFGVDTSTIINRRVRLRRRPLSARPGSSVAETSAELPRAAPGSCLSLWSRSGGDRPSRCSAAGAARWPSLRGPRSPGVPESRKSPGAQRLHDVLDALAVRDEATGQPSSAWSEHERA